MYSSFSEAYDRETKTTTTKNNDAIIVNERSSFDLRDNKELTEVKDLFEMVVVDCYADWCQPCKHASKKFEELGKSLGSLFSLNRLILFKDNIERDDSPHRDKIDVVPTFFVYIKSRLVKVFTGVDFDEMKSFIYEYFQNK